MKLYRSLKKIESIKNSVVSIGMFDGVHLGHLSVINRVIDVARENNLKSIIITFSNSPTSYFSKDKSDLQITNTNEKIDLFNSTELDYLFVIEFNQYIANLNPTTFVNDILISFFNVKYIVFGYDNHFGKNREGTFEFINKNFKGIKAELIVASKENRQTISSTRIKEEILEGNITSANKLLGRNYNLNGKVVKGLQLGRKLGFPTANLNCLNQQKLIPKNGVYYTKTNVNKKEYLSVTNIGTKPSVQNSNLVSIETHILDFDQSIYHQTLSIKFIDRIRNEIKFNHIEELIEQITKDIIVVRKLDCL
jgi:riboflavin kinase/FMN adenylyltransferase